MERGNQLRAALYVQIAVLVSVLLLALFDLFMLPFLGIAGGVIAAFGSSSDGHAVGSLLGDLVFQGVFGTTLPIAMIAGIWLGLNGLREQDPRWWATLVGVQIVFIVGVVFEFLSDQPASAVGWLVVVLLLAIPTLVLRSLLAADLRASMVSRLVRPTA